MKTFSFLTCFCFLKCLKLVYYFFFFLMRRERKLKHLQEQQQMPFAANSFCSVLATAPSLHLLSREDGALGQWSHSCPARLLLLVLLNTLQSLVLRLAHSATCSYYTDSQTQTRRFGSGEGRPEGLCPWQGAHLQ